MVLLQQVQNLIIKKLSTTLGNVTHNWLQFYSLLLPYEALLLNLTKQTRKTPELATQPNGNFISEWTMLVTGFSHLIRLCYTAVLHLAYKALHFIIHFSSVREAKLGDEHSRR